VGRNICETKEGKARGKRGRGLQILIKREKDSQEGRLGRLKGKIVEKGCKGQKNLKGKILGMGGGIAKDKEREFRR